MATPVVSQAKKAMNMQCQHTEISSASPCIGYCTTVLGDDICRNCLRTFDEVTRWVEMSNHDRRAVNQRIALLNIKL
jgi:predicted Fe-S protein YdhL (DUF1289 family)